MRAKTRDRRGWDGVICRNIGIGWSNGLPGDTEIFSHPTSAISEFGDGVGIVISCVGESNGWDVVWVAVMGAIGVECCSSS